MVCRRHVGLMYVELHAASAFSFLEAASLPETLVDQAARYGYPAIALLDRDGVYGAPRFHRAAAAAGIKAIIGAELTIAVSSAVSMGTAVLSGGRSSASAPIALRASAALARMTARIASASTPASPSR